ncbi:MAG: hypothetical protein JJU02_10770 [Cryomorphaceae bacterium]|nr:hypothetical protein [Cryomorphaceae bacterium]
MKLKISIFVVLLGCNSIQQKENTDCMDVVVDEKIEILSDFNKSFYDEDYTGKVESYFKNNKNQLEWVLYYKNGEIVKFKSFYENGDPKIIKPILCNAIHGNLIYYMENSRKGYELAYKFGRKDGIGKSYFENGNVQKVVRFKSDQKHGEQYELSESGDTLLVEVFEHGELIK